MKKMADWCYIWNQITEYQYEKNDRRNKKYETNKKTPFCWWFFFIVLVLFFILLLILLILLLLLLLSLLFYLVQIFPSSLLFSVFVDDNDNDDNDNKQNKTYPSRNSIISSRLIRYPASLLGLQVPKKNPIKSHLATVTTTTSSSSSSSSHQPQLSA